MLFLSGNSETLKRMNRKYDTLAFKEKIDKIKKEIPNIALTTDVIVGFPGESEEEFNSTKQFIKDVGFNMLHVFPFSPRKGTKAYNFPSQVSPEVKNRRVHELLELSDELWLDYQNRFLNQEVEVLIEQYKKDEDTYIGHTSNYLEVKVKCDHNCIGENIKTIFKK